MTYRYIKFDISRLGEPESHSGAKVMNPIVLCQSVLFKALSLHAEYPGLNFPHREHDRLHLLR